MSGANRQPHIISARLVGGWNGGFVLWCLLVSSSTFPSFQLSTKGKVGEDTKALKAEHQRRDKPTCPIGQLLSSPRKRKSDERKTDGTNRRPTASFQR